jgi:hypothetical protein
MTARLLGALAIGLAILIAGAGGAAAGFQRGATLVEFFNFPATTGEGTARAYADPPFPRATDKLATFDFGALRRIGFDHMRVPLDLGPMMRGNDATRATILAQLKTVIAALRQNGLSVLVTLNPPSLQHELPETYLDGLKGEKFRLYFDNVMRVAAALAPLKDEAIALEPMNEPQDRCRKLIGTDWTEYQKHMVERIRAAAPDLPLFLTGGCWSNIEGIELLDSDLVRDRRNYISVHFYYPFLFTHQSAHWTMPHMAGVIGVPYPASAGSEEATLALTRERFKTVTLKDGADRGDALRKAERETRRYFAEAQGPADVEKWMQRVATWQQREKVAADRIVFTEFGAMKQTVDGVEIGKSSRTRWLYDVASAIERRGWGWTVYVLRDDPFGLYEHEGDRSPDPALLRALRLRPVD